MSSAPNTASTKPQESFGQKYFSWLSPLMLAWFILAFIIIFIAAFSNPDPSVTSSQLSSIPDCSAALCYNCETNVCYNL